MMLTGTRKLASASWRALGTSVVVRAPVDSMWRTIGVAATTFVEASIASAAALVRGTSCVVWLAESGPPARLVARDGRVARVGGWPDEPGRQPEVWAR